mmetsp:Transcript_11929/g.18697  ORF Transcript_11929/g.18697 Transcript_11929/m.18697 type:complete len:293 (+) Transcript_11929:311-1189(+)|eukprot:CAMPEP_0184317124 /NCGR_PEP_ID=MMETSP1049-20130417/94664_1 /TAXON_ID=77928 /ORGANISM="Proteomonas sulcata, Strain CCMP704" /LENGTH=292 /DNA_ID=CAMNT_0026636387 /DNA_START=298 /DNA_END=1176 /DNA_ORIENTATION=-
MPGTPAKKRSSSKSREVVKEQSPSKKARTAVSNLPVTEWKAKSSFSSDLQVLRSMWFGSIQGDSHQDRLESFYKSQAELYDGYRCRMLHARFPMMSRLPVETDRKGKVVWVDLGGGTGSNVEYMSDAIKQGWFKKIVVLDLTPSLCQVAKSRMQEKFPQGLVDVVCGDACDFKEKGLPASGTCDIVTFSYALVMIPRWADAIANALRLLKPGGHLCVCDFTVLPDKGQWEMMQNFWKKTFAQDHVHLSTQHREYLKAKTDQVYEECGFGGIPYVPPFLKAGWYVYIGRKKAS